MTENNPTGRKTEKRIDGIVDELRNVLSKAPGVSMSAAPEPEPQPPVAASLPTPDPVFEPSFAPEPVPTAPARFDDPPPANDPMPPPEPAAPKPPAWLFMNEAPIESAPSPAPVEPAPAKPAEASLPPAEIEIEIGLPMTRESRETPEPASPSLELNTEELKPEGLRQIACVFPQGQEDSAREFARRFKETGAALRKPVNVQDVLMTAWRPDSLDVDGWTKAAKLSGADAVYVMTFRSSAGLFRSLNLGARKAPRVRLVWIEHVETPALYADLLVELRRDV